MFSNLENTIQGLKCYITHNTLYRITFRGYFLTYTVYDNSVKVIYLSW